MSKSTFGGGVSVKASSLLPGNFIRDPRRKERILVVEDVGNVIFARGLDKEDKDCFKYISCDSEVTKVTDAITDTSEV